MNLFGDNKGLDRLIEIISKENIALAVELTEEIEAIMNKPKYKRLFELLE